MIKRGLVVLTAASLAFALSGSLSRAAPLPVGTGLPDAGDATILQTVQHWGHHHHHHHGGWGWRPRHHHHHGYYGGYGGYGGYGWRPRHHHHHHHGGWGHHHHHGHHHHF